MTVKELIDKLERIPNKNADVDVTYGSIIVCDRIIYQNPAEEDDLK